MNGVYLFTTRISMREKGRSHSASRICSCPSSWLALPCSVGSLVWYDLKASTDVLGANPNFLSTPYGQGQGLLSLHHKAL